MNTARSLLFLAFAGLLTACDSTTDAPPSARILEVRVDTSAGPLIRTATVRLERLRPGLPFIPLLRSRLRERPSWQSS